MRSDLELKKKEFLTIKKRKVIFIENIRLLFEYNTINIINTNEITNYSE